MIIDPLDDPYFAALPRGLWLTIYRRVFSSSALVSYRIDSDARSIGVSSW